MNVSDRKRLTTASKQWSNPEQMAGEIAPYDSKTTNSYIKAYYTKITQKKGYRMLYHGNPLFLMVGPGGFEPPTSTVSR